MDTCLLMKSHFVISVSSEVLSVVFFLILPVCILYMHIFKFKSVIFLPYESQNLMQKHLWETFAKMVIAVCGLCTVACVLLDNFV